MEMPDFYIFQFIFLKDASFYPLNHITESVVVEAGKVLYYRKKLAEGTSVSQVPYFYVSFMSLFFPLPSLGRNFNKESRSIKESVI